MQTRIRDLRGPAVMGGCAVLGGAAVRQLGIEIERAWMRSYDGPLMGESFASGSEETQPPTTSEAAPSAREQRRWISEHERPRLVSRVRRPALSQRG
jgi:hypothetical protein